MIRTHMFAVLTAGLLATGCSYTETRAVAPGPVPVAVTGSQQACLDYGFAAGTAAYDRCIGREREARARGRVIRGYAESQLAVDARDACYSYGLEVGSPRYDRCVGREIDARRYREEAATYPSYPVQTYQPSTYQPAYVETRAEPTGVPAFKDEYNFRYDGQGNRLDRNGNIISPQSTRP